MKQIGLLFKGEMVRAILEGRKTVTRRLQGLEEINESANDWTLKSLESWPWFHFQRTMQHPFIISLRPKFSPGSIIYVKETFSNVALSGYPPVYFFRADGNELPDGCKWTPSIFMPKALSRIWLRVADVRCERLQEITEEDALAEGVKRNEDYPCDDNPEVCPRCFGQGTHQALAHNLGVMEVDCTQCDTAIKRYKHLWDSINTNPATSWDANPFVWRIQFYRVEKPA